MRLLVSMLHRVIKYQLNSHTGMSYCSLMFTSVLSDIRLLLSFFRLLLDNPKTMQQQKKKTPNKNKQSASLLRVTQSLFHRLKFMFQHVLQCCFYLLVSPLKNVIKGKGRCKTKPKRDEPKLRYKETQGNHKETHTTL